MLDQLFIQSSDPAVQPKAILQVNCYYGKASKHSKSLQAQHHTDFHVQCFTMCYKMLGQAA